MKYKEVATKVCQVIKNAKRQFWDSVCQNASDSDILRKTFRRIRNRPCPSPDTNSCLPITDANIQVEIFANHSSGAAAHELLPLDYGNADNDKLNRLLQLLELKDAIRQNKPTSPGFDRISTAFFKRFKENLLKHLLQIYNNIWSSSDISPSWTSASFCRSSSQGNRRRIASYRPIALTSVTCNICESQQK